jgi:heme oxygenase
MDGASGGRSGERAGAEPARHALRAATHGVHEALHRQPDLAALAEGRITRERYARLLGGMHGFHAGLEPAVRAAEARFAPALGGFRYRPRRAVLAGDLAALGAVPGEAAAAEAPALASPAALAGAVYVLDGSLLGATTLERAARALPFAPAGTAYWAWCRRAGPDAWRAARGLIARLDAGPAARAEMETAARATFAAFAHAVGDGRAAAEAGEAAS